MRKVANLFGGGFSDTDPAMLTVGDVKQLSAMIEALVDYLESREWSGPHVSVTRLFRGNYVEGRERSCEGCNGTQASGHKDDCRWLAMMRAAGRR